MGVFPALASCESVGLPECAHRYAPSYPSEPCRLRPTTPANPEQYVPARSVVINELTCG